MPDIPIRKVHDSAPDDPDWGASDSESLSQVLPWDRDDWDLWTPRGIYGRVGHRSLDLLLFAATLPLTLPILLVLWCINSRAHTKNGGALFVQQRVGLRGRVFSLVKFRTMAPAGDDSGRMHVTRLGRFMRNTHLDELPQVVHVLFGQMSFIGPRPEMVEIEAWAADAVPAFSRRLAIRPGITGLAQITQGYTEREAKAYREKLRINNSYSSHMALHRDLWILARTLLWMLRARGWRKASEPHNLRYIAGNREDQRKAG